MPQRAVRKVAEALNERCKSVKGSKALVLGIAYESNIDDMRESPAVELLELLQETGTDIAYSDPSLTNFPQMRQYHFELSSVPITPENQTNYDCVLVATNHDAYDYTLIKQHAKLIVNSRGVYLNPAENIVEA